MTTNLFLGLGGTGSKAVENFIHLCAAGLGPNKLWMGMVDQDSANGNVAKTKTAIDTYIELRKDLKNQGKNFIPDDIDFLKTQISYSKNNYCWCPLEGTNPSLHELFSYDLMNEKLQDVADVLFDPKEEFQLPLDEGFRARPSIGAAAMLSRIQEKDKFWKDIFNAIEKAKSGENVKIFLSSSIFGGTGAAGFPSIARVLRRFAEQEGLSDNLKIGGCLMLPYFSFPKPSEEEESLVGYSDSFVEQSKGALDYYHRVFGVEEQHIFSQLYIVGWSPLIPLGYFEKGGNNQINPPLIPELYGALAAAKFFQEDEGENGIFHIANNNETEVQWSDIPEINEIDNFVRDKISQLVRMSIANKEIYQPALLQDWKKFQHETWFKKLFTKMGIRPDQKDEFSATLSLLNDHSSSFLKWTADMLMFSDFEGLRQSLIQAELFASKTEKEGSFYVSLEENIPKHKLKSFKNLINGVTSSSLSNIFYHLNDTKNNTGASGLGAFVTELYQASNIKGSK